MRPTGRMLVAGGLFICLLWLNIPCTNASEETASEANDMPKKKIATGVVHDVPPDMAEALIADSEALVLWEEKITPLGRNEWICWVEDAKQDQTRCARIERARAEIKAGKRRPCCWPGCPHREKTGHP